MNVLCCIDTCTWLNLGSNYYKDNYELLEKIERMVYDNKVHLFLPDVILEEWNRHKESKIIDKLENKLSQKTKQFNDLADHLEKNDKMVLEQLLKKVASGKSYFNSTALDKVSRVESLFRYKSTKIIPIIDEVKMVAVEYALNNKRPFAQNKNSMGDALIFLSATEYARGMEKPLYFITDNKLDFSATNHNELHDDLKQRISDVVAHKKSKDDHLDFYYFINIASALNSIEENIVSKELERSVEEQLTYPTFTYTRNEILCPKCNIKLNDMNNGRWSPSRYGGGLTWWLVCHNCGTGYDTSEFYD